MTTTTEFNKIKLEKIFELIKEEFNSATINNNSYNSAHEGYAVILEELDELWDEVKKKNSLRDKNLMKKEAVQVASSSIRFIYDLL